MSRTAELPRVVLDPTDERIPASHRPAPRLDRLRGKTVALLDISKARGEVFLARLAQGLEARGARVEHFRKPTFARPAPLDLRRQIATRCEAVIEALAD